MDEVFTIIRVHFGFDMARKSFGVSLFLTDGVVAHWVTDIEYDEASGLTPEEWEASAFDDYRAIVALMRQAGVLEYSELEGREVRFLYDKAGNRNGLEMVQ